ncbi:dysferlin-like protein [Achlya hypogyna]|uniref:Dysferlin-like protein n=1 Tax=Achlya hypogyna TaxID=1202772 RepID=A0A1V9ZA32_ACHHY|nr:dysferlin-like protein [Achlya hypogyna]
MEAPPAIRLHEADEATEGTKQPNTLRITVLRAQNVAKATLRATTSLYCKLSAAGRAHKTTIKYKTIDPVWNETFSFRATDFMTAVTLVVADKVNVKKRVVGQVRLVASDIMGEPMMRCTRWYPLADKNWAPDARLGEVEIKASLVYDRANDSVLQRRVEVQELQQQPIAVGETWDMSDVDGFAVQQDETEEEAALRQQEAELQEKLRQEAMLVNVPKGDYQIQAHIIEARDLKGENFDGTSDPVCYVEVMGKKQKTSVKSQTFSCVFDEMLFFRFRNIGRKELEQATISVSVYDSNLLRPNIEIGTYQFDCMSVYCRPQREVYRQWLALVDHKSKTDKGVQGYLLVSLAIVGPGEAFPVHEPSTEAAKEGADLVLVPPSLQQQLHFLVVTVIAAEELPAMDAATLLTAAGIDAFVRVDFAGNVKCKTSVVVVKGARALEATFLEQLWIPVLMPTMSRRITLSVRDRELGRSSEVVGQFTYDFLHVPVVDAALRDAAPLPPAPLRYVPLYGPPLRAKAHSKAAEHMKKFPDHASTYRGRLLVGLAHVMRPAPDEPEKLHVKDVALDAWEAQRPPSTRYVLRVALFFGQDLPPVRLRTGLAGRLLVVVSVGSHGVKSDAAASKHGRVLWTAALEAKNIVLPSDLSQLPDVIVTLCRETGEADGIHGIAFARIRAGDLVQAGFNVPVRWVHLLEEVSRPPALPAGQSPGSLLMRLAFGREELAAREPWPNPFRALSETLPCIVRVHVYQCRGLFCKAAAKHGLPDPQVVVHFGALTRKTKAKRRTLDPLYYETLQFDVDVPSNVELAPELWLQVGTSSGVVLGELRLPLAQATKSSTVPYPTWHTIANDANVLEARGPTGEVLLSVQYLLNPTAEERAAPVPSIVPECRDAVVDVIAMGVRGLKSNQLFHIQNPFVEFELAGGAAKDNPSRRTKASHEPESKNANFLERLLIPARLPIDVLFRPQLVLKVYDSTMGGLHQPLIASCVIDLTDKLPWSPSYVPPQQQEFDYHVQLDKQRAIDAAAPRDDISESGTSSDGASAPLEEADDRREDGSDSDSDTDSAKEDEVQPATRDDGTGIGELPLPRVSYEPPVSDDPAVQKQLQAEADRRLYASVEDARKKGRVYVVPGASDAVLDAAAARKGYDTPAYFAGRDWWIHSGGRELEEYLKTKPFETYPLFRAHTTVSSLFRRRKERIQIRTGVFKGLVSVTLEAAKSSPLVDFASLTTPKPYEIRVYVLRGTGLQPKDRNGLSDPYLRLQLGQLKINDRANHFKKTLNPDFYRLFTLEATIPGTSQLSIAVWDYDRVGTDSLIGETIIDLEDRWFHKQWQDIGQGHPKVRVLADPGSRAQLKGAGSLKPIEYRPLWTGTESTSQGTLQLWVDILTPPQAALFEPIDIAPPPPKKFEVRVVIWKSEGVVDKELSETNDLFVKAWMEGHKAQSTDIHWRCSTGKASWNYRMKFQVQMPMKPELARLHVQLWEKDLLKWQDIIGGTELDLYRWLQIAYHENRSVLPFKETKAASRLLGDTSDDEDDGDDDHDNVDLEKNEATQPLLKEKPPKAPTRFESLRAALRDKSLATGHGSKGATPQEKAAKRAAKEANEAKEAIGSFMDFIGLGRLNDDSDWLVMRFHNREAGVSEEMGKVAVGIQIVTEAEFSATPVGMGRNDPNLNPYLPPTVGRIKLSANPFNVLRELVGPKMCARIACFVCCVGCLSFLAIFGASIMSALTFYEQLKTQAAAAKHNED